MKEKKNTDLLDIHEASCRINELKKENSNLRKLNSLKKRREILKVIKRIRESHPSMVEIFTRGGCYKFFLILKEIFPEAVAYYDSNHIITEICGKYYDITGEVPKDRHIDLIKFYSKKTIRNLNK